jgi:hypothetical protein
MVSAYRQTIADLMEKRVGCVLYPLQWDVLEWRSSLEPFVQSDDALRCAALGLKTDAAAAAHLLRSHGYNAYEWEIAYVMSAAAAATIAAITLDDSPLPPPRKSAFQRRRPTTK